MMRRDKTCADAWQSRALSWLLKEQIVDMMNGKRETAVQQR